MASTERRGLAATACALGAIWLAALAPAAADEPPTIVSGLKAEQLFELASRIEQSDANTAEQIYQALEGDPHLEVRNEARFRHAHLLAGRHELAKAEALYRAILEEQPDAPRVRIELAAILAQTGNVAGARHELETAQRGGLPPDVARVVDQYAAALRSNQPYGASFEFAFIPSNNINRATTATELNTVIAPFQLSDDARAKSGIGVRLGGQAYYRAPVDEKTDLTFKGAAEGSLYRTSSFNDIVASAQVGLESEVAQMKLRPFVGRSYRWYGEKLYATTDTGSLEVEQPLGLKSLLTTDLGIGRADYRGNNLQNGDIFTANFLYERSSSPESGLGFGFSLQRQDANDPGYATTSGGLQVLLWRKLYGVSAFADLHLSRLGADERLALFPERRWDWLYSATLGATFPQFAVRGFAPVLRVSFERNDSTVGVYDYSRWAGDIGFTRAF